MSFLPQHIPLHSSGGFQWLQTQLTEAPLALELGQTLAAIRRRTLRHPAPSQHTCCRRRPVKSSLLACSTLDPGRVSSFAAAVHPSHWLRQSPCPRAPVRSKRPASHAFSSRSWLIPSSQSWTAAKRWDLDSSSNKQLECLASSLSNPPAPPRPAGRQPGPPCAVRVCPALCWVP